MVIWKQNEELLIYAIYNKIKIKIISLILKNVHRLKKRLHTFEGPTLFASIFNTKNTHGCVRSTTMTIRRHFMTQNFGYLILKPNRFSILRFEIKTLCFFKKKFENCFWIFAFADEKWLFRAVFDIYCYNVLILSANKTWPWQYNNLIIIKRISVNCNKKGI